MKHHVAFLPLALLLCIILAGCEPPKPAASASNNPPAPPPAPGTAPPPPPAAAALPLETQAGVFAGSVDDLAAPAGGQQPAATPLDPSMERVKAQAGVGIKGRSLDEYEGAVVTPVKALFRTKETITFVLQFQHQYDIYKAMEDTVPKDFDDLKAKVLDPYLIKLPELPMGHKYVWDAAKEELQVERPKLKQ